MHNTQTYSQYDIGRYLQRKMSQQEMHDFEKALMDDPFLADAIEGFSASDPALAESHLMAIENELGGTKGKAKVVALADKKTAWWKVAAIVLVVVSGSALTYSLITGNEVSKQSTEQVTASTIENSQKINDSIGPVEKPLARIEAMPEQDALANQNVNPPFVKKSRDERRYKASGADSMSSAHFPPEMLSISNNKSMASLSATQSAAPAYDQTSLRAKAIALPPAAIPQEFKGKVLDKTGEPLPFASVRVVDKPVGTVADAKGEFTLKAPDSIIRVSVISTGYANVTTEIKSNPAMNNIILEEEKSSLAEVVISSMQARKEKRNAAYAEVGGAEPEGGWSNFDQYMHHQVDSLKTGDPGDYYDQDVVLEFSIDKEGRPTDIRATDPSEKKIAEKAKQILSNGPKWKNRKKDKKVKVIIPF